jgi:hypothetical protein
MVSDDLVSIKYSEHCGSFGKYELREQLFASSNV